MYENTHRRQGGMSLIEVFVALLVLSVGLIALARLQVDLVRGGSDARTRSVALALAEEKVEDLRTFAVTDNSPSAPALCPVWSTVASPMCWAYIAGPVFTTPADTSCGTACRGGRIAPQTTYSSALEVAGVRFKRTWEVDNRDFTNAGPPSITSRTKDVRVTIAWMNELGVEQQVSVLANVVEIPPGNVALASQPIEDRPDAPRVTYTPGEAPEVIAVPIDVGTGKRRETSKPLPEVQARGYSNEVTFDVVNYHVDGSDTVVDRREEFTTVNCRCALAGTGRGRTPARVAFTGTKLRDAPGKVVTSKPQTGVVLTSGPDGESSQPVLCAICCRDHHDGPAETLPDGTTDNNRYQPTAASDHRHYLAATSTEATATGAAYDEACRLKRVNGVFQVFEDWDLATLTVLPKTDLDAGAPKAAEYIQAVQDFAKGYADAKATGGTLPTRLSFTPSAVSLDPSAKQLLARAIYVDRMPSAVLAKVHSILSDGDPSNDASALALVPFYEVHLTKLADWLSRDTAKTKAKVTSNAIPTRPDDGTVGGAGSVYSRGLAQPQSGATSGSTLIIATARNHNTGITNTPPINLSEDDGHPITETVTAGPYYYTNTDPESLPAEHKDGSITVEVGAGISISGSFQAATGSPRTPTAGNIDPPTGSSGAVCTSTSATGRAVEGYTCTVPASWTGTITFTSTGGYSFCAADDGTRGTGRTSPTPCTALVSGGIWTISSPVTTSITQDIFVWAP